MLRGSGDRNRIRSEMLGRLPARLSASHFVEVGLGVDVVLAAHAVVAEAAELSAGDLEVRRRWS